MPSISAIGVTTGTKMMIAGTASMNVPSTVNNAITTSIYTYMLDENEANKSVASLVTSKYPISQPNIEAPPIQKSVNALILAVSRRISGNWRHVIVLKTNIAMNAQYKAATTDDSVAVKTPVTTPPIMINGAANVSDASQVAFAMFFKLCRGSLGSLLRRA